MAHFPGLFLPIQDGSYYSSALKQMHQYAFQRNYASIGASIRLGANEQRA